MNRRILIVPVVGAAVFAGSQLITGGGTELPPEPVFPTVVGNSNAEDWTTDGWSVNRFVDDPFRPSLSGDSPAAPGGSPTTVDTPDPAPSSDAAADVDVSSVESTTTAPPALPAPTPTTAAPAPSIATTTTTSPPLVAPQPGGTDVPAIDDLPGPEDDVSDPAPGGGSDR